MDSIHNLSVQQKRHMFFWRVTSNMLRTRNNLVRRGIFENVACINYEFSVENDKHALFDCRFVRKVWLQLS